jgi:hypothetical protein
MNVVRVLSIVSAVPEVHSPGHDPG